MVRRDGDTSTDPIPVRSEDVRRSRRHFGWAAATALLTIVGVAVSILAAGAVGRNDADKQMKAFQRSSASIASTLQLSIQHEDDMVVDTGGFFLADPDMSQAKFLAWTGRVRLLERYRDIVRIGALVIVDAAGLPAFAARTQADRMGASPAGGRFAVVPAGTRPFYCLSAVGLARPSAPVVPAGLDLCADPVSRLPLLAARDSGQGAYAPYSFGGNTGLALQTPIYRGGATPATVQGRRAAFVGWIGTQVDPALLLSEALRGQPDVSAVMRYRAGAVNTAFASGPTSARAHSVTIDLHNGWTVQTFGKVRGSGYWMRAAVTVVLAGTSLTVLLALLMFVLGTGRERARRQLEQRTGQLNHQVLHDALTGLPNRALVMDRIEQMLARGRRNHASGAAMFMDLDDFKNVNDTLGHGAGDRLLVEVAARLRSTLRDADTIARMGGDEFVVLIDDTSVDATAESVAERVLDVTRQPFELGDAAMPFTVNISIGIATGDRATGEELLRDADVALYQAKAAGKNRYAIFDPHMQTSISRRADLEFDLRTALARDEFRLVYQPIYNLGDLTVVGVEALLRWDHPTRGVISPDEFIPILEQTGQISEVGRWVLKQACQQMATWRANGDVLDVSVNVSSRQLEHDRIVDDIRDALHASGLPAGTLIIEITEAALMRSTDTTARRLHAVKELGVKIAVDDFGTGYSSLPYLRQFPVDCLKIDRKLTHALNSSPESKALIGTLVQLGKALGLSTLAEGVETTEEMDLLRGAEVYEAQGFLLAHPLEPEALESQLLLPIRATPSKASRS